MDHIARGAGILLHITSLPGKFPVGTLGEEAFRFVDFLADAGHTVWQILPFGPPARGNSPYSSLSAFAGNPLLIDPRKLEEAGLLPTGNLLTLPVSPGRADYAAWTDALLPLLRLSFRENAASLTEELSAFRAEQGRWLSDYAHFMALRDQYGANFRKWPRGLFLREEDAMTSSRQELAGEIAFHEYVQYLFFTQWKALHFHAREKGVLIFGDVPIYVDMESADVWANPELFLLGEDRHPLVVAGVPPDAFSEEGQLWGNPLYDWDSLKKRDYDWWLARMHHTGSLCDLLRIDHFRGLSSYWAVPAKASSAKDGRWQKGPGLGFVRAIHSTLPGRLVAEDLGDLDDAVRELLRESGLPGLAVLEFAFSPWEDSNYLPHNITADSVAYIGTHDNDTAMGWLSSGSPEQVSRAREYLTLDGADDHWVFLHALYGTRARLVIAQMQDFLGLGSEARMNTPSLAEGNWLWRMERIPTELAPKLRKLAASSNRK